MPATVGDREQAEKPDGSRHEVNSPYHVEIGRHHRHTLDGEITQVEFTGLAELIDEFQNEVTEIYEQRTD